MMMQDRAHPLQPWSLGWKQGRMKFLADGRSRNVIKFSALINLAAPLLKFSLDYVEMSD
jgi:hypothetical protein